MRKEHRVPLSPRAVAILAAIRGDREQPEGFVFAGEKGEALSQMALLMLLRRMEAAFTVHGFRSTFRDWAGDKTHFAADVAEAALAHKLRDKTGASYRRASAFEKRRTLMNAWADFLDQQTANAVQLPVRA
jgi:integrase